VYLHYVLDLWFERVAKPRLRGEAYLVRYIDDFVLCFQYRADALRVQKALCQRLRKFGLTLESTKTKLVKFGRFPMPRFAPVTNATGVESEKVSPRGAGDVRVRVRSLLTVFSRTTPSRGVWRSLRSAIRNRMRDE
jgi:hypothetical protein